MISQNLALHECGHMFGYFASGAAIVTIRPEHDGIVTTGYPSSPDADTQLDLISGMVATVLFDTRLSKVRDFALSLLGQHPEALPALLAPLEAYDRDIEQLDTDHPSYCEDVQAAVALITTASATEEWQASVEAVMSKGKLCQRREGSTETEVLMALNEMNCLPMKGAA
jgi:hypothetical protein